MPNTYGDSGNRWWVAYNTSQQDKTILGTSVGHPLTSTPSGYEALPSGNAADDAQFAAAAKATKAKGAQPAGKGPTISVENITWANVNGPYSSKSAATAAIPGIQKANAAPGGLAQIPVVGPALQQAQSDVSSVVGFLSDLGNKNLWIRVAKVMAGGIILIVGLMKLTGADKKVGGFAAKAVKVAPLL
jgi:hypothetical protein